MHSVKHLHRPHGKPAVAHILRAAEGTLEIGEGIQPRHPHNFGLVIAAVDKLVSAMQFLLLRGRKHNAPQIGDFGQLCLRLRPRRRPVTTTAAATTTTTM
jgi:hypothetical protein